LQKKKKKKRRRRRRKQKKLQAQVKVSWMAVGCPGPRTPPTTKHAHRVWSTGRTGRTGRPPRENRHARKPSSTVIPTVTYL
jgi:hypothetical protein